MANNNTRGSAHLTGSLVRGVKFGALTSIIHTIVMVEDLAVPAFSVLLVGMWEQLMGVPHEIHIIAWHNEHVRPKELQQEELAIPNKGSFKKCLVPIMRKAYLERIIN